MAHKSENSRRLSIQTLKVSSMDRLPHPNPLRPEVWMFVAPFDRTIADAEASGAWFDALNSFAARLHGDSIVAILTSTQDSAETLAGLKDSLRFQLWIAVKLATPIAHDAQQLPRQHAALLICSKYRKPLRHTKTRIGYTYCPACDKTTKDYGGKKHTYHEYGTLLSDIWRDVSYSPPDGFNGIAARLADLFGLEGYSGLTVVDLTDAKSLRPRSLKETPAAVSSGQGAGPMDSRLINGDSLAELRAIPENSVEFCYADPPYNLAKVYDSWDDSLDAREYLNWCGQWIDELARILRPGCTCAVLNIPVLAARHFQQMKRSLTFQSWIAWEGLSLPVRMIMPAHYATVCFSKGPARPLPGLAPLARTLDEQLALTALGENFCGRQSCIAMRRRSRQSDREPITDLWWDIHRLKHNSRRVDHPCQLPPALMRRLIALFTYQGEIVLDPFNGAGTTTLCADALGRRYIGMELSEKYHLIAMSRHKLLHTGGDPFEKASGVPTAKNSRVGRIGGVKYAIPKKKLQLEVKRLAQTLGHIPTREELEKLGRFPIRYYDEYFISWGEVCAAARTTGMSENRHVPPPVDETSQPLLFG